MPRKHTQQHQTVQNTYNLRSHTKGPRCDSSSKVNSKSPDSGSPEHVDAPTEPLTPLSSSLQHNHTYTVQSAHAERTNVRDDLTSVSSTRSPTQNKNTSSIDESSTASPAVIQRYFSTPKDGSYKRRNLVDFTFVYPGGSPNSRHTKRIFFDQKRRQQRIREFTNSRRKGLEDTQLNTTYTKTTDTPEEVESTQGNPPEVVEVDEDAEGTHHNNTDGFTVVTRKTQKRIPQAGGQYLLYVHTPVVWSTKQRFLLTHRLNAVVGYYIDYKVLPDTRTQLHLRSEADTDLLMKHRQLREDGVIFVRPMRHNTHTQGLISGVPIFQSDGTMHILLRNYNVTSVRRLTRWAPPNGTRHNRIATDKVVITFAGTVRPAEVKMGPRVYPVIPYNTPPTLCSNCQRYGHNAQHCRSRTTCRRCAGPHTVRECSSTKVRCSNCGARHASNFANCPVRQEICRKQALKNKQSQVAVGHRHFATKATSSQEQPRTRAALLPTPQRTAHDEARTRTYAEVIANPPTQRKQQGSKVPQRVIRKGNEGKDARRETTVTHRAAAPAQRAQDSHTHTQTKQPRDTEAKQQSPLRGKPQQAASNGLVPICEAITCLLQDRNDIQENVDTLSAAVLILTITLRNNLYTKSMGYNELNSILRSPWASLIKSKHPDTFKDSTQ